MQCRICLEEDGILVSPCKCRGTAAYIHTHCLERYFQYYPDRVCRVCRYEIKSKPEVLKIWTCYLYLNTLVFFSSCELSIKFSLVFALSILFAYYFSNNLFTNTPLLFGICLSLLFIPGGNESAMLGMICILSVVAFFHSLFCLIPIRYLLLISINILVIVYACTLSFGIYYQVDSFAFGVYMCILYLIWYPWSQHLRLQVE